MEIRATSEVKVLMPRRSGDPRGCWQVVRELARRVADLADPKACARAVRASDAAVAVNAAAADVAAQAEEEPMLAEPANATATGQAAAARVGVSGAPGRPWRENDPTRPLDGCKASKLAQQMNGRAA